MPDTIQSDAGTGTGELTGLELRKAVARVIGFDVTPCEDGGEQGWWISTPKDDYDYDPVNGYWHSTEESAWGDIYPYESDACMLPDMWGWLEGKGWEWEMGGPQDNMSTRDGKPRLAPCGARGKDRKTGFMGPQVKYLEALDDTNPVTAVARLVVAVSQWEREKEANNG